MMKSSLFDVEFVESTLFYVLLRVYGSRIRDKFCGSPFLELLSSRSVVLIEL